jgi:hypothetical protein
MMNSGGSITEVSKFESVSVLEVAAVMNQSIPACCLLLLCGAWGGSLKEFAEIEFCEHSPRIFL